MAGNEYLVHYGTKGMKWGVRHWQNADGSYNEAGERRYRGENSKMAKAYRKAAEYKAKAAKNREKAKKYSQKRDDIKSRIIQTDVSIWRAERADRKRARAEKKARRQEHKAAKLERRAAKWAQDSKHGSTSMSVVSGSDHSNAERFISRNS